MEPGKKCTLPFDYKGYRYFGCIKKPGQYYWCPVNDGLNGVKKYNCSESCPTDYILSSVKYPPEEIIAKLKITPKVFSMIERGGNCGKVLSSYNLTQV